jgi:hypothetical protein
LEHLSLVCQSPQSSIHSTFPSQVQISYESSVSLTSNGSLEPPSLALVAPSCSLWGDLPPQIFTCVPRASLPLRLCKSVAVLRVSCFRPPVLLHFFWELCIWGQWQCLFTLIWVLVFCYTCIFLPYWNKAAYSYIHCFSN